VTPAAYAVRREVAAVARERRHEVHLHPLAKEHAVACTNAWGHADRTPEADPLAEDQAALGIVSWRQIVATVDRVVPGPRRTARDWPLRLRAVAPAAPQAAFANLSSTGTQPSW
jgi:hypothetical protein